MPLRSKGFPLHRQIFLALALAVAAGLASGEEASFLGVRWVDAYGFLGDLFLNSLKMIAVPLVFTALVTGVASVGSGRAFGRLGWKTLLYYLASSLAAILTGLLLVNLTQPGVSNGRPVRDLLGLEREGAEVAASMEGRGAGELADLFLRMVPENVFRAAAEGQMLGLIVFAGLFGFFLARLRDPLRESQGRFWEGLSGILFSITNLVMRLAPVGVFGLVASVAARTGLAAVKPLLVFFLTVLAALAVHAFLTLPLALSLLARVSPLRHYRAMAPALLTAFSTASSAATLPLTLECLEKRVGVSRKVGGFVLPLGATVNMDGTALYECVAVLFIAQAYGVELSAAVQFLVVWIALLTSIGVAGVPAASLVAIVIILRAAGLPAEGLALLLATDRVLDMFRTSVNVLSDSYGAVVVARSEGEKRLLAGPPGRR